MPLKVTDYSWSETDDTVFITVPLKVRWLYPQDAHQSSCFVDVQPLRMFAIHVLRTSCLECRLHCQTHPRILDGTLPIWPVSNHPHLWHHHHISSYEEYLTVATSARLAIQSMMS